MTTSSSDTEIASAKSASRRLLVPVISGGLVAIFILTAIFADALAPHSPTATSLPNRLTPPAWMSGGTWEFPLGTDQLGRDILSRIIHGASTSLFVAAYTLAVGAFVGGVIGLVSGYFSGKLDAIIMRLVDVMLSLPIILFALILVVARGPSVTNLVIAMGLALWARFARIVRGDALSIRERDFVALSVLAGASHFRILRRHMFPNIRSTLMVLASLQVGWVILVEATLSFLGAGIPPPLPAWGSMIAQGREFVTTAWWLSVWPGLVTMMVVMAFNLFGDWLRDYLDPKLNPL